MAGRYLTDLDDVARRTGFPVIEVGGGPGQQGEDWKRRARRSNTNGYSDGRPDHVMVHHTASGAGSDGWPDVNYCLFRSDARPLMNLYISRKGDIYVCAAGCTNTNGSGTDMCGMANDAMNTHAIGIEAGNDGRGELWPDPQLNCYNRLCKELCDAYGIPIERIHSHWQYAIGRKIDAAGGPRYQEPPRDGPTPISWNMVPFCNDVRASDQSQPPPTTPQPEPPPTSDWVNWLMNNQPTLVRGNTGRDVKRMQHLLASNGYMDPANTSNYDGVFGSGTEGALNRFKTAVGGRADGRCDPWTWGALMHTVDGIPTLKKGAQGADVKRMQHLLAAMGYLNEGNTANYDGVWGNGTDSAKVRFDNDHGLKPSPPTDCGSKSWESLLDGHVW
jgi:peptidoglycan hydrolase-like protein with peptidoglycan-binding domain